MASHAIIAQRFFLALIIARLLPVAAVATDPQILAAINKTCIATSEMAIADLQLGDRRGRVESHLGMAVSENYEGWTQTLEYDGLQIQLRADRIQTVKATNPRWTTPSGLRTGMTPQQAGAALKLELESIASPHSKSPRHYQIHRCIGVDEQIEVEQYLRLDLSAEREIEAISIFWVSP